MVYPAPGAQQSVIDVITQVAKQLGVPPVLALSIAFHESGLDPKATGDNGTSFGLFQLHKGGELGSHSRTWAENPYNNARTALSEVARVLKANPGMDWGQIAAKAQRPLDQTAYAQDVNDILKRARGHQAGIPDYFNQALAQGGKPTADRFTGGAGQPHVGQPAGYNTVTTSNTNTATGGNGVSVTINSPSTGGNQVPELTKADFKAGLSEAGFSMGLIKSDPELLKIFNRAINKQYWRSQNGINRFLNEIQNSTWFRSRSDAQMKFDNLSYSRPGQVQQQLQQAQQNIAQMAQGMGVDLTPQQIQNLAHTAVRNGLTDQEIQHSVVGFYHFDPKQTATGQASADIASIRQMADNYYVPLADKTMDSLTGKLLDGTLDSNSLQAYFQQQAESMFPHLKPQMDAGMTVADVAGSYVKNMADTLELNPDSIKVQDPTVMKALQSPDGKGGFQLMPLWQFNQMLKQDPRWLQTDNANSELMGRAGGLLKNMGLVA